jgi:CRISPR-associated protein Csx14
MKNILLAVTGLSPQVITETLYALYQSRQTVAEVRVITTRNGKERIYAELLSGKTGHYHAFLSEYNIDPATMVFNHETIRVVKDKNNNEISDIITTDDNEQLLQCCLDLAFYLTQKDDQAVFFSVAGGRKTMSSCLTLAAQMYGRPQDRLYHVLVSPEFESNRDFFYPPVKSRKLRLRDPLGQPYFKETKYARIHLVNIPFFSVRNQLSPDCLNAPKDPATLMLSLIKDPAPHLLVHLNTRKIIFKTLELDLMPSYMALYGFFAMRKKQCTQERETCVGCRDCFPDITTIMENQDEISKLYRKMTSSRTVEEMSDSGIMGLIPENFRSMRSKLNKMILAAFGPYAAPDLEIAAAGTRPDTVYSILMDKTRLTVVI